ncbi:hypothetical protein ACFY20_44775 [Streptomyces sp. NPDC001312]|uniref:hypothetical protein n=1 Tax=Streptomyces sp. NPDC001312 TaxID=3364561 RepID=UPI0036A01453
MTATRMADGGRVEAHALLQPFHRGAPLIVEHDDLPVQYRLRRRQQSRERLEFRVLAGGVQSGGGHQLHRSVGGQVNEGARPALVLAAV